MIPQTIWIFIWQNIAAHTNPDTEVISIFGLVNEALFLDLMSILKGLFAAKIKEKEINRDQQQKLREG